ncbi:hypothetical protein F4859DRAFT_466185 [Xylaria cf. heliscus]|nr:hypothetical protein F4859DRAFT_466185 [Xylaria cf. heliscus]
MDPPRFTFVTTVGTAGLSETAAKQMRSHVTKCNFAKRRARVARPRKEAANKSSRQLSPGRPKQSIVTSESGPGASQTSSQQAREDDYTRIYSQLSLNWSLLFMDGTKYPGTANEAAWIGILVSEPALVQSSMAIGLRNWSPDKNNQQIACDFSSKATESIIQRIRSGRVTTDAVLAAVLTMAFGERLVHNNQAWNIHMDGAAQLVYERISQGLPALSPWLEDLFIKETINDVFGFSRYYHKKLVIAACTAHDFKCSPLIRMATLCENLACWMEGVNTSRKHPQKSDFIMEHIMQPMYDMLSEARAIRVNGSPTLQASCITVELIIYLSWSSSPEAINLNAVASELKEATCASQFRPCYYFDLTCCQLMIGAIAADEGSPTRAWFMDRLKSAWRIVKSRGCNNAMDILERNMTFKTGLKAQFKSLWIELDRQLLL